MVSAWVRSGRIVPEPDGSIDPEKADASRAATTDQVQVGKGTTPPGSTPNRPSAQWMDRYTRAHALREEKENALAALKLRVQKGELVDRKQVASDIFAAARTCRNRILGLPDRLSGELAPEMPASAVRIILARELASILDALANELQGGFGAGLE